MLRALQQRAHRLAAQPTRSVCSLVPARGRARAAHGATTCSRRHARALLVAVRATSKEEEDKMIEVRASVAAVARACMRVHGCIATAAGLWPCCALHQATRAGGPHARTGHGLQGRWAQPPRPALPTALQDMKQQAEKSDVLDNELLSNIGKVRSWLCGKMRVGACTRATRCLLHAAHVRTRPPRAAGGHRVPCSRAVHWLCQGGGAHHPDDAQRVPACVTQSRARVCLHATVRGSRAGM